MKVTFSGEVWYWRGPPPHYFVTVPAEPCQDLQRVSGLVSYGWGMIPVTVGLGSSTWTTSLFPKDGGYIVPLKAHVRAREGVDEGQTVTVELTVDT